jgi:ABC-type sulfate transport system substrate-binding protein
MNKKVVSLKNDNGIVQGTMSIEDNYSYNEDTNRHDILTPKVEIKIEGEICISDTEAFEEELKKLVRAFLL